MSRARAQALAWLAIGVLLGLAIAGARGRLPWQAPPRGPAPGPAAAGAR